MHTADKTKYTLVFGTIIWIGLIVIGLEKLNTYSRTPGESAKASLTFPFLSDIKADYGKASLVVFIHPKCSCSRATLAELARLVPPIADRTLVSVIFLKPGGFSQEDVQGGLWNEAMQIPNVKVQIDINGKESELFGAKTSGQTYLYDPQGRLVFEGGITPSRGHTGEARGQDYILNYFTKSVFFVSSKTSVFGCGLNLSSQQVASRLIK